MTVPPRLAKHWYSSFTSGTIEAQWEVLLPPSARYSEVIRFFITVVKIPKKMILEGYIYRDHSYRGYGQSHQKGTKGGRNSSLPYGGQKKKKAKRRARWPSRDTPKCVCFSPNGPNSIFPHVSVVTSYLSPVMKGLIYSLGQSFCDHAVSGRATTNTRGMLLLKYFLIQSGWWPKFSLPVTWVFNFQLFLAPKERLQPSTNHDCRDFFAGGEMCFADLHVAHLKHMVIFFYKISLA